MVYKIIYFFILIFIIGLNFYLTDTRQDEIKINDYQLSQITFDGGKDYQFQYKGKPFAIVSSHHLFAKYLINSTFKAVNFQPDRVIILGPNHFDAGSDNVILASSGFAFNDREIEIDQKAVYKIIKEVGSVDNSVFEKEHSIYSLLPFVKKYFPKAKVVPIILKYQTKDDQIQKLSEEINELIDSQTLVVISADFCHDMSPAKEAEIDRKNIEILKSFDEARINNLVVDTRASFKVLFKLLESNQIDKFQLLKNTNSGLLGGNGSLENATSYIFGAYLY